MFAIVQFKHTKYVRIIPCSWIFGFDETDINGGDSYNAFFSTAKYPTIDWTTPQKTPTTKLIDNNTYKVYIKSVHSKYFLYLKNVPYFN